jgi:hypothetical protein
MKLTMLLALGLSFAHAAEPTGTLRLACEGTRTEMWTPDKPEPVSMGIIVDFGARTVSIFGAPIPIEDLSDVQVVFNSTDHPDDDQFHQHVGGTIDRVTGDVGMLTILSGPFSDNSYISLWTNYSLQCKPTQRMF